MSDGHPEPVGYRLAEFSIDLEERTLSRDGRTIDIQDQPFELLLVLLEQPGRVVSREAIIARLWPGDTYVDFERSLNTAVRKVRRALGERASEPRFVATVPKRGYRLLIAPEPVLAAAEPVPAAPGAAPGGPGAPRPTPPVATPRVAAPAPVARSWWARRPVRLAGALLAAFFCVGVGMVLPRPGGPSAVPGCGEPAPGGAAPGALATPSTSAGSGTKGPSDAGAGETEVPREPAGLFRTCESKPYTGSPHESVRATTCQLTTGSSPRSASP